MPGGLYKSFDKLAMASRKAGYNFKIFQYFQMVIFAGIVSNIFNKAWLYPLTLLQQCEPGSDAQPPKRSFVREELFVVPP
ncbi:10223_t:CDS:2, partial [Entrophospora sp. SA101]